MCYKYSVKSSAFKLQQRFNASIAPEHNYQPYYHANGFANHGLPVITMQHPNEIKVFEWALVPHFAKTAADAKKYRLGTLNAKSETVFDLPSFRGSINTKRCLVLADGFYESMDVEGKKYPFYIYRKDQEPFAFAGIYSNWKREDGSWLESFSILTTEPNDMMRRIHNIKQRMPVILPPDKERKWLQPDLLKQEIHDLTVPLEDGILTAHPVNKALNQSKQFTNEEWIMEVNEYPELEAVEKFWLN